MSWELRVPLSRIPASTLQVPLLPVPGSTYLSVICLQFTAVCCFTILFNCILISHMANFRTSVCCVWWHTGATATATATVASAQLCVAGCTLCLRNCLNFDLMHNFHRNIEGLRGRGGCLISITAASHWSWATHLHDYALSSGRFDRIGSFRIEAYLKSIAISHLIWSRLRFVVSLICHLHSFNCS